MFIGNATDSGWQCGGRSCGGAGGARTSSGSGTDEQRGETPLAKGPQAHPARPPSWGQPSMPVGPPGSKHHPAGEVPRSNLIRPPQPSAPSALGQNHHLAGSVDWRRWCGRPNGSGLYLLIEPTFIKHLLHAEAGAGEGWSEQRRKGCGSGGKGSSLGRAAAGAPRGPRHLSEHALGGRSQVEKEQVPPPEFSQKSTAPRRGLRAGRHPPPAGRQRSPFISTPFPGDRLSAACPALWAAAPGCFVGSLPSGVPLWDDMVKVTSWLGGCRSQL